MDWTPPAEFEEYRLLRPLGRGAMGQVFLAHDTTLDREVAVKFLALPPSQAALGRFLVEARAAARLQHPNVVTVYRVGALDGRPFIVAELLRGQSLDHLHRPTSWRQVLRIGIDLARGLAAAHRAGVLHRDLKPANAILRETGEAVLVDFGLAKVETVGVDALDASAALERSSDRHERRASLPLDLAATATPVPHETLPLGSNRRVSTGESPSDALVVGTPYYMAPEVLTGEPATARSDVYSLGTLLYELCSGQLPFRAHDYVELASRKTFDDATPLASLVEDVDPRFARLIHRCLERDPQARFASADELREALEALEHEDRPIPIPAGNPYRGLLPFGPEHRALFFGRASDARAVIDRLRGDRFVLVVGESGVGKSSLCRAAVAPAVVDGALGDGRRWTSVTHVPGRRPVHSLAAVIVAAAGAPPATADELIEQPVAGLRAIHRALGAGRGLLVLVDQLEELVTVSEPDDASAACRILAAIAEGPSPLRLLATARGDLLSRLATLPALGPLVGRALHALLPLDAAGVRESIVGPARATGVRFADEAIVAELVATGTRSEAGLPLLQFALAELWERRTPGGVIDAAVVAGLGGVEGALARHAERVLAELLPAERTAARRILVRLATTHGTRALPSTEDLVGGDAVARTALDRLTAARLLVARQQDDDTTVDVAHEALFTAWPRLRDWMAEEGGVGRLRERIAATARDWERDGRPREALWGPRALLAAEDVPAEQLDARSRAFLAASRRARTRRRVLAIAGLTAAVGAATAAWAAARWTSSRELDRTVSSRLADAEAELAGARALRDRLRAAQTAAFAAFDARDVATGETRWGEALALVPEVATAYGGASSALEAALRLAPGRGEVRELLLEVLYERALLAEAERQPLVRDELLERIAVYDDDGAVRARWAAPARVRVRTPQARVVIERYEPTPQGRLAPVSAGIAHPTPAELELAPGSYVLVLTAAGRAEVRVPIVVARGEALDLDLALPSAEAVPAGFVYVPAGRFRFGSSGDEGRRSFFSTAPEHERTTDAFLIARHEATYADWIAFLEALPPDERDRRRPKVGASGFRGLMELAAAADRWILTFQPTTEHTYRFDSRQRFRYVDRDRNAEQDWLRFPVSGVSWQDVQAYLAWLREGALPGARACREDEWERAARGADSRAYAHGDQLLAEDANVDLAYGRKPRAFGPDEVGRHPASDSPFGLADTVGNVFEMTTSVLGGEIVARGGAYHFDAASASVANRQVIDETTRDSTLGFRVCADVSGSR